MIGYLVLVLMSVLLIYTMSEVSELKETVREMDKELDMYFNLYVNGVEEE